VDKWQRKTQVTSGAAGMKNKFQAFNQVCFLGILVAMITICTITHLIMSLL